MNIESRLSQRNASCEPLNYSLPFYLGAVRIHLNESSAIADQLKIYRHLPEREYESMRLRIEYAKEVVQDLGESAIEELAYSKQKSIVCKFDGAVAALARLSVVARDLGVQRALNECRDQLQSFSDRIWMEVQRPFIELRSEIRSGNLDRFRSLICDELKNNMGGAPFKLGEADAFFDIVLGLRSIPEVLPSPLPYNFGYQSLALKEIVECIKAAQVSEVSQFCDLGFGVGRTLLAVALFTGARVSGVEIQPKYVDEFNRVSSELALSRSYPSTGSAESYTISNSSHVLLANPFGGPILRKVCEKIEEASTRHPICVIAYGACANSLAGRGWRFSPATNKGSSSVDVAPVENSERSNASIFYLGS